MVENCIINSNICISHRTKLFASNQRVSWFFAYMIYKKMLQSLFRYYHSDSDSTSISSNLILSLLEDKKGNLWIGTYDNGLNYFDKAGKTFTRYVNDYNVKYKAI